MPRKIKVEEFEDIARGTTVTIPIVLHKVDGTPYDLNGCVALFTLKAVQSDYDYDDDRALISKEIAMDPELVEQGRFNIVLSSRETWLPPGEYYFDVVLVKNHSVGRLCLCRTHIVGGPNNACVDDEVGDSIYYTNPITIDPDVPSAIHLDTPLVTDPPADLIETITTDPKYLLSFPTDKGGPQRHAHIENFGPRVSVALNIMCPHDGLPHRYSFNGTFHRPFPNACPLKDSGIVITDRTIHIESTRKMNMFVGDMQVQHSPEVTVNGNFYPGLTTDDNFLVGDNVSIGQIHIQLVDGNDMVDITGHYQTPDTEDGFSYFMLSVNWYNWIDLDPEDPEPEPEPDTEEGVKPGEEEQLVYTPGPDTIWPPDIHY